jgi:diadenosine tetraphosphate (Ap4A) HIT family hydrolase
MSNSKDSLQINLSTPKPCAFCDAEILKTNYIISEDEKTDVRVMMNRYPYFSFDQGVHLLIMPLSHKEHPDDFYSEELNNHMDVVKELSAKLYPNAYTQEYVVNWGKLSGQSQRHWHGHIKSYTKVPMSVPQKIKSCKNVTDISDIEQAFEKIKKDLASKDYIFISQVSPSTQQCPCCIIKKCVSQCMDEDNLVIARFKYNYVCLSHYPRWPGELSVVPNEHVCSIKDLSREALHENIMLAMKLLPKVRIYAQQHIRECDGGNIFIKSMGGCTSNAKRSEYHLHTLVIPRTALPPITPGGMDGNSCKLHYDPVHMYQYFKEKMLK